MFLQSIKFIAYRVFLLENLLIAFASYGGFLRYSHWKNKLAPSSEGQIKLQHREVPIIIEKETNRWH